MAVATLQQSPDTTGRRDLGGSEEAARQPIVRSVEVLLAVALVLLSGPVWLLLYLAYGVPHRRQKVGLKRRPIDVWAFPSPQSVKALAKLPYLLAIMRGDLAFVGPRLVDSDDPLLLQPNAGQRFEVRPGLACLHWLRTRTNVDFRHEVISDLEYAATRSWRKDLGILMSCLASLLYGGRQPCFEPRPELFGFRIDNLTMSGAVSALVECLRDTRPKQVCFVNADCVNNASRDGEYRRILSRSAFCFADGIGLKIAGDLLGKPIRQNVNGTDLFPILCEKLALKKKSLYLLGARPGVAAAVAGWVRDRYSTLRIAGISDGYFGPSKEERVVKEIASSGADVLLVAMGVPAQEKWISRNLERLRIPLVMGVGGLFDFYSGRIPRAPQWMRELGLEWVYRLYQEPARMWRRYLVGNAQFLCRTLLAKYSHRQPRVAMTSNRSFSS